MRDKWVKVVDDAGIERTVRGVDAREIEAAKAEGAVKEVVPAPEPLIEVDDQSVAPKAATKTTKSKVH